MQRAQRSRGAPWVVLGLVLWALGARAQGEVDAGVAVEREVRRTQQGLAVEASPPAADGGVAVGQAELVPPSLVEDSVARYPAALEAAPVAGTVRLELQVDEVGEVALARLVEGVHPLLDKAALHAATRLRFTPAQVRGQPVAVRLYFDYRFEAPSPEAPKPLPPVTLRGLVRTKGNRRPIVGATLVSPQAPDRPVETGLDGRFEARLPPGAQWVQVSAPGHKPGRFYEQVREGEALEVVYGLEPLVINPYETVVRGDRERTEVSRISLEEAELREVPGTAGDPFRVVMLLPGVSSLASGLSYPIVRGSAPAATAYYLDGVRVPILFHLFIGSAVVHPDFIDGVDFFPGTPPSQYGRLMGGVVEGRLTEPRDDRFHGSGYADLINAGLFLEYPLQQTGTNFSVAGRFSYTPWLIGLAATALQPPPPPGQQNPQFVLDFYDYQARVEQEWGGGKTRVFAFGASDTLGQRATNPDQPSALQSILFHRLDVRHRQPVGPGELEAALTLGLDRLAVDVTAGGGTGGSTNIDQRTLSLRAGWKQGLGGGLSFRAGADVERKAAQVEISTTTPLGNGQSTTERFSQPVALATLGGGWAELLWQRDKWTVVPGLRVDSYHLSPSTYFVAPEPRVSVRYRWDDKLTLKGGGGLFHQAPTWLLSLPVVDLAGLGQGLQQAMQWSAGAEWKVLQGLDVSVEGYVNPLLRTVELLPLGANEPPVPTPPDGGAPPPPPSRTGGVGAMQAGDLPPLVPPSQVSRGWAYGLEVMIRHPLGGNWFGWLSYTLQRSTRVTRFNRYDAQGRPVERVEGELPFAFDQTHILNLVLSYKFQNGITAGTVVHFNTGRPEAGVLTSQTQVPGQDATGRPAWVRVDRDRADRLPPFFRVDARVSKAWAFDTFTLEAYLDVLNLSVSQEVFGFSYLGGGNIPLQKQAQGFPIALPTLGLKGQY